MLTGTNLTYTKAFNYRIVFETIRLNKRITRAEIARETTLTAQTISNIVKRLIEADLILEGEKIQEGRGAPSVSLQINPQSTYSIGLDYNRDHLTGVLADLAGDIQWQQHLEIDNQTPDECVQLMGSTIKYLIDKSGISEEKLGGIGVAFPGPMKFRKAKIIEVVSPKAFPEWHDVPIVKMLSSHISSVPIIVENNATAAAMGEKWYGNARDLSDFVYLFFGAGLGGGIIIDGQVYNGSKRNAGEIGYFPLPKGSSALQERDSHIGVHFDMERLYKWLNRRDQDLDIKNPGDLEKLFDKKHPAFAEWLQTGADILTMLALQISYTLDPETIILGGRLPKKVLAFFRDAIEANYPSVQTENNIEPPAFVCATAGAETAALGAATLPMYNLFSPQHDILLKNGKR